MQRPWNQTSQSRQKEILSRVKSKGDRRRSQQSPLERQAWAQCHIVAETKKIRVKTITNRNGS